MTVIKASAKNQPPIPIRPPITVILLPTNSVFQSVEISYGELRGLGEAGESVEENFACVIRRTILEGQGFSMARMNPAALEIRLEIDRGRKL
ncbi:MAG: hypothetical protein ABSF82_07065 [Candidatus Bathyarchaeia archaeon]